MDFCTNSDILRNAQRRKRNRTPRGYARERIKKLISDPSRMFDARLGLALGKSIEEIHTMPYPSYRTFELMYMIEPWGWINTEQQVSRILSMLLNLSVKKKYHKQPSHFMRNILGEILKKFEAHRARNKERKMIEAMTIEERRAYLIPIIKRDMGVIE